MAITKSKSQREGKTKDRATLAELRRSRGVSQAVLSTSLCVTQPYVARLEKQPDMCLSTLRRYIEALGGELLITARFPDKSSEIDVIRKPEQAPE
jgi:transcriptional regulator with XRE-family HTH domain